MNNLKLPAPQNFRLMVIGQIISILGSALLRFALSLYILDITGRADMFATLFAISNIPLLLSPIGGAIADRFSRKKLMVLFDFISGSMVCLLFSLMYAELSGIAVIAVIMVALSTISAMYTPAVTASIPQLVESHQIEAANGTVQAVQALSGVAAPIIGGVLYGMIGIDTLVLISGIAFFLSAVMEIFIYIPYEKREMENNVVPTIAGDLKNGFCYVITQSFVRKAMVLAALLNLLLTPFFLIGAPIILRITMGSSDTMYGIGMGLINGATILGALSVGYFGKKLQVGTLYKPFLLITVFILPMAISVSPFVLHTGFLPPFLLFLAGGVPVAMIMTILSIFVIAKVQKKTPNENLGKVMAIMTAVSQCAAPVGQLLYGALFEAFATNVFLPTVMVAVWMLGLSFFARQILGNERSV